MPPAVVHPAAYISSDAELADDVVVDHGVTVEAGARLGPRVHLYPNAFVGRNTELAADVAVHMGAIVGHVPQDVKFDPDADTHCRVGERTQIREYATIHRATKTGGATVLGRDCMVMNFAHVGHDCVVGDHVILANAAMLGGHVLVEDRAYLAPQALVHQFTRIGSVAMLSAHAAAGMDVPPYHIVEGRNELRGLNAVGMKRAGLAPQTRRHVREAHKLLFRRNLPLDAALAEIAATLGGDPAIAHLIDFCRNARRGLMRPAARQEDADEQ